MCSAFRLAGEVGDRMPFPLFARNLRRYIIFDMIIAIFYAYDGFFLDYPSAAINVLAVAVAVSYIIDAVVLHYVTKASTLYTIPDSAFQGNTICNVLTFILYIVYLVAEFAVGGKVSLMSLVMVFVLASKAAKIVAYMKLAKRAKVERSGNYLAGTGGEALLEEGKAYNTTFVSQPTAAATTASPMTSSANNEPIHVTGVTVVEASSNV